MVAAQVCQSQLVGRSEDSHIGVPVHSSRVGVVPVSSEGPSSILDVSAGAVVSISSATSMVGQGSKVNRDSVSPLVSFAQPIVSSVVSVDELDDRVANRGPCSILHTSLNLSSKHFSLELEEVVEPEEVDPSSSNYIFALEQVEPEEVVELVELIPGRSWLAEFPTLEPAVELVELLYGIQLAEFLAVELVARLAPEEVVELVDLIPGRSWLAEFPTVEPAVELLYGIQLAEFLAVEPVAWLADFPVVELIHGARLAEFPVVEPALDLLPALELLE
ncbi:hypothetical protein LWI29_025613 [Acer saccharum]|uniref:Uncharacterized protein n=1 Tax=Acer saccharum TaxID=4024 RepID=A0AA39VE94_ACESA|nr:hypothetical protein LWI29_025613 [Acer saccharum]